MGDGFNKWSEDAKECHRRGNACPITYCPMQGSEYFSCHMKEELERLTARYGIPNGEKEVKKHRAEPKKENKKMWLVIAYVEENPGIIVEDVATFFKCTNRWMQETLYSAEQLGYLRREQIKGVNRRHYQWFSVKTYNLIS